MNFAIIVASGEAKRMKGFDKIFGEVLGFPIIYYLLKKIEVCDEIDEIILVVNEKKIALAQKIKDDFNFLKIKYIVAGGKNRFSSVLKGFDLIQKKENIGDDSLTLIHNGANILVDKKTIKNCMQAASKYGAACAAVPEKNTLKLVDNHNFIKKTLDRTKIWEAQTPQVIKTKLFEKALEKFTSMRKKDQEKITDDVSLLDANEQKVKIIQSNLSNFKITYPEDIDYLEFLLSK